MALLIEAKITLAPEGSEKLTMQWLVAKRNEEITRANERLPEGGKPAPLLLASTVAELRNSTEIILKDDVVRAFERHQMQASTDDTFGDVKLKDLRPRWDIATTAERNAALAQLPAL